MTTLTQFLDQLDVLVAADDNELTQINRERMIKAALERYSRDKPDTQTDDITGDGGRYYAMASSLSNWVEEFSRVIQIEYPAADISSDELPQMLNEEEWQSDYWKDVSDVQTRYLFFPNYSPAATETIRVTYTIPYELAGTPASVSTPAQDFYAICNLAACLYCQSVAAKYARLGDSTIGADSTAHVDKSQNFAARAKEFCQMYEQAMGVGGGITGAETGSTQNPCGSFIDWDTAPGYPAGRNYVFHGRRTR